MAARQGRSASGSLVSEAGRRRERRQSNGSGGAREQTEGLLQANGMLNSAPTCAVRSGDQRSAWGGAQQGCGFVAARGEAWCPPDFSSADCRFANLVRLPWQPLHLGLLMHGRAPAHWLCLHSRLQLGEQSYLTQNMAFKSWQPTLAPSAAAAAVQPSRAAAHSAPSAAPGFYFMVHATGQVPPTSGCALHDVKTPHAVQRRTHACMCVPAGCILRRQALPLPCRCPAAAP